MRKDILFHGIKREKKKKMENQNILDMMSAGNESGKPVCVDMPNLLQGYARGKAKIKKDFPFDTETIYGQVVSKANNYMVGRSGSNRHIIKSPAITDYERSFIEQCKVYRNRHINGRFVLYVAVYESNVRYDLDNALKTILDCLQMVCAITDDNLCVKIVAEKRIDKNNPRIVFAIGELEPTLFKYG